MFYIKFDTDNGNILGCINYVDTSANLLQITKEQYIDFVVGKLHFNNYKVIKFNNKYILEKKQENTVSELSYANLYKLQSYNDDHDILVKKYKNQLTVELKNLLLKKERNNSAIVNLYLTELNNPISLIQILSFNINDLIEQKKLNLEIYSDISTKISIYTKKRMMIGYTNE